MQPLLFLGFKECSSDVSMLNSTFLTSAMFMPFKPGSLTSCLPPGGLWVSPRF